MTSEKIGRVLSFLCLGLAANAWAAGNSNSNQLGAVVFPGTSNAIQLRLYTNASPGASHLFNTFDLEAFGQTILQSPGRTAGGISPHSLLVNDAGPLLDPTNGMRVIEEASGAEWRYIGLDASRAYRGKLEQYKRGILFIQPDLFVIHDHLVADKPANFQFFLHPSSNTVVDPNWHDLHLGLAKANLVVHAPSPKGKLRSWEKVASTADQELPGTATMRLAPGAKLAELDLLTVFAVRPAGENMDFAFKLLESTTATGVRIHRDGYPTLVAFKTSQGGEDASLTGFGFSGPVGVSIFRPRPRVPVTKSE